MTADEIKKLATSLRKIKTDVMKHDNAGEHLWYQGSEKYFDLFVDRDANGIQWVQLSLRGRFVEWKKGQGISTGTTNEQLIDHGNPRSKLLKPDTNLDSQWLQNVHAILAERKDDANISEAAKVLKS